MTGYWRRVVVGVASRPAPARRRPSACVFAAKYPDVVDAVERHRHLLARVDHDDLLRLHDRLPAAVLLDRQRHRDLDLLRVARVLDRDVEREVRRRGDRVQLPPVDERLVARLRLRTDDVRAVQAGDRAAGRRRRGGGCSTSFIDVSATSCRFATNVESGGTTPLTPSSASCASRRRRKRSSQTTSLASSRSACAASSAGLAGRLLRRERAARTCRRARRRR